VTGDNHIVLQLRGVALKLTSDAELRKDLLQEMFVHLFKVRTCQPAKTSSWYVKSCEFHARNYLKLGRSIDSLKRARNGVPLDTAHGKDADWIGSVFEPIDPLDLRSELITKDIIDLVLPHLTDTQQRILFLLLQGFGVREVARELGISHPAVVKQRKKIARLVSALLDESSGPPRAGQSIEQQIFGVRAGHRGCTGFLATRAPDHFARRR
jgi:RNA polymerase sigma factor (sigma-70 family)